jgi:hypothetical protein
VENAFQRFDPTFKPPEAKPSEAAAKPSEAAAALEAPPKPASVAPPPAAGEPKTPKELRDAYQKLQTDLNARIASHAALEAKIKQYEAIGKEAGSLKSLLTSKEKRINELEAEKRALKWEASPEFKKQYEQPFDEAAENAATYVSKLRKTDGTQARWEDFIPLYRLAKDTTMGAAKAKAQELFGDAEADEVMFSVRELVRLDRVKTKAYEEEFEAAKSNWKEKEEHEHAQRLTQEQAGKEIFGKVNADLQASVELYRDPPEDKEASTERARGLALADAKARTPQELCWKLAHCRQMVGAFFPLQLQNSRLKSKVADLEKQVAGLKPRGPGGGDSRPGGEAAPKPAEVTQESWAAEARKAMEGIE